MSNRLFSMLAFALVVSGCSVGRDQNEAQGVTRPQTVARPEAVAPPEDVARPEAVAPPPAEAPPEVGRRRLQKGEVTRELEQKAGTVLKEHGDEPIGTEVPFELDGRSFIARIEQHYHEPGSSNGPWGLHKGVTLYIAE